MKITVYADSTQMFTEEFCNRNNLINIEVDKHTVEEYYKQGMYGIPFEEWLNEYTADDTEGLWIYATYTAADPRIDEILM